MKTIKVTTSLMDSLYNRKAKINIKINLSYDEEKIWDESTHTDQKIMLNEHLKKALIIDAQKWEEVTKGVE